MLTPVAMGCRSLMLLLMMKMRRRRRRRRRMNKYCSKLLVKYDVDRYADLSCIPSV